MISFIFYRRPPPLKFVTMATRNALFSIFKFQKFTNTYLGKVTKFQLNCFSRLGATFKKPVGRGAASAPLPVRLGLIKFLLQQNNTQPKQHICGVNLTFICNMVLLLLLFTGLQLCSSSQFSYPLVNWQN